MKFTNIIQKEILMEYGLFELITHFQDDDNHWIGILSDMDENRNLWHLFDISESNLLRLKDTEFTTALTLREAVLCSTKKYQYRSSNSFLDALQKDVGVLVESIPEEYMPLVPSYVTPEAYGQWYNINHE